MSRTGPVLDGWGKLQGSFFSILWQWSCAMARFVDSGKEGWRKQGTPAVEVYLPNGTRVCLPSGDVVMLRVSIQAAGELSGVPLVSSAVSPVREAMHEPSDQHEIIERLEHIEAAMRSLTEQPQVQKWYDTATAAKLLGKSPYSVREWCRLARVRAEKRACGRGRSKEWMIAHEELMRIKAEGLLPLRLRAAPVGVALRIRSPTGARVGTSMPARQRS